MAGFVDAFGFLDMGGYFVSFMSGNSTRFAVSVAASASAAWIPLALIAAFVAGVVAGALTGSLAGAREKPAVLALVSALTAASALLHPVASPFAAHLTVAAAMGAANNLFQRDGEVAIGLTYMTGALVKLGQRLAAALRGGDPWGWAPYLLLWLGLTTGAVCGALTFAVIGGQALWVAAGLAVALTFAAWRLESEA